MLHVYLTVQLFSMYMLLHFHCCVIEMFIHASIYLKALSLYYILLCDVLYLTVEVSLAQIQ